jgi:alpha-tubulin suppressor-like RCC1 family protein
MARTTLVNSFIAVFVVLSASVLSACGSSTADGSSGDGSSDATVTAVAAGGQHTAALKSDGTVWAWGRNDYGQLGDGDDTLTNKYSPVQVSGLTGVSAISLGEYHSLALKTDGTVWAWGQNWYGQLGDGTTSNDMNTPIQVSGLTGVTLIAAGGSHSVAVKSDGTVWSWGRNDYGQLGDGTTTDNLTPVQVIGLTGVSAISAISAELYRTIASKTDGTVWVWGRSDFGQLSPETYETVPVAVDTLTGVSAVSAGEQHLETLNADGIVSSWGGNSSGQIGSGTSWTPVYSPEAASGLTDVAAIAAGAYFSAALKADGTVWAWGQNEKGQLGDGTTQNRTPPDTVPVQVTAISGVTAIDAGGEHAVVLKADGTVWAWGLNWQGQLGNSTTTDSSVPVQTVFP